MARGQGEVRYRFTGENSSLVQATRQGEAALDKLGSAAQRTNANAGKLADGIGKVSTTLARSASLFGLPVNALRALDDAADVAELGLGNLTKAAAGFNVASVGVAGAGLAIGTAIGTALRWIGDMNNGMGALGLSTRKLDADMRKLWQAMVGGGDAGPAVAGWQQKMRETFDRVQANVQVAQLNLAKNLQGAGLKSGEIRDVLAGKEAPTAAEQFLETLEKQEEQTKKNIAAAERAKEAWIRSAEQARKEWDSFYERLGTGARNAGFDLQKAMIARSTERADVNLALNPWPLLQRGPDLSRVMGGVASGAIAPGAGPTLRETTDAGIEFSQMLGDVAHAFQLLGVGPDSILGRFVGSMTVIGASLDKIIQGRKQGGLAGILGQASGWVGIAATGFSLIKGLFGGGPSKEEREAERKRQEEERRRIQKEARETRARGVQGLMTAGPEFFAQRTIATEDDARRQGALFAAAWGTVVREKGIVAAADAFRSAFDKMKADIEKAGLQPPAWLTAIGGEMELGLDETFRALAQGAQTAADFLRAFAESGGILTAETLGAFEEEARRAFQGGKDVAAGLGKDDAEATKAGFAAANPILRELLNQSVVSGTTLSADIQALIQQAGIVPDVEYQQLDELRQIRAAVQALAGGGYPGGGGGGGQNDTKPPAWVENIPQYAGGKESDHISRTGGGGGTGVLGVLHDDESVVPDEDAVDFAKKVLGGSSTTASVASALSIVAQEARRKAVRVTVNAPVQLDPSLTAAASREDVARNIRQEVSDRLFQPHTPEYRRLVRLIESRQRRGV